MTRRKTARKPRKPDDRANAWVTKSDYIRVTSVDHFMSARNARQFGKWLIKAADYLDAKKGK